MSPLLWLICVPIFTHDGKHLNDKFIFFYLNCSGKFKTKINGIVVYNVNKSKILDKITENKSHETPIKGIFCIYV